MSSYRLYHPYENPLIKFEYVKFLSCMCIQIELYILLHIMDSNVHITCVCYYDMQIGWEAKTTKNIKTEMSNNNC